MFGNSTSMKQLKITAINKGNSKLKNVGQELLNNISKSKSDIVILSEANHDLADPVSTNCTTSTLKDYNIEFKTTKGSTIARIMIIIKKDIVYERLEDFENDFNCAIVIKLKQSKKKHTLLIGAYRQWKSVGSTNPYSSDSTYNQVIQMKHLMSLFQKVLDEGSTVLVGGDLNVDRHLPNDPLGRADLKDLYPMLDA